MKITKNFDLSEFECKCGCKTPDDVYVNIVKLANQLQTLRDVVNKPIKINSGYRCEQHNKDSGGVSSSQHLLGNASDIKVKGYITKNLSKLIDELISNGDMLQGGLGIYDTFVHYDIRKTKTRWDYRK